MLYVQNIESPNFNYVSNGQCSPESKFAQELNFYANKFSSKFIGFLVIFSLIGFIAVPSYKILTKKEMIKNTEESQEEEDELL